MAGGRAHLSGAIHGLQPPPCPRTRARGTRVDTFTCESALAHVPTPKMSVASIFCLKVAMWRGEALGGLGGAV